MKKDKKEVEERSGFDLKMNMNRGEANLGDTSRTPNQKRSAVSKKQKPKSSSGEKE